MSRTHMRWLISERYYDGINESRPESRQIQKQKLVVDLGNLYYPLLRIPSPGTSLLKTVEAANQPHPCMHSVP